MKMRVLNIKLQSVVLRRPQHFLRVYTAAEAC